MNDILHRPTRPARVFPPLKGEPDFNTALCESIAGRELPQSAPKTRPKDPPKKPLFELDH